MHDLRQFLRTGTRDAHEATEMAFAPFRVTTKAGFTAFLTAQARAIVPLETALSDYGQTHFTDWDRRLRAPALLADLHDLGTDVPSGLTAPPLTSDSQRIGAVYVLEGSHMGAKILLKRVLTQGDPVCHEATRFLRHGQGEALWPAFLTKLSEIQAEIDVHDAANGALKTFAFFEAAARSVAEPSEQAA